MATLVSPVNLQKIEFDTATAEGASRVTIVTGKANTQLQVSSPAGSLVEQRASYKVLLDPTLTPGKFRKAVATVSVVHGEVMTASPPGQSGWAIEDAQATFDDEAGRVQLIIDLYVSATGAGHWASVYWTNFQVTTLAIT